jgi:hypothetical protein
VHHRSGSVDDYRAFHRDLFPRKRHALDQRSKRERLFVALRSTVHNHLNHVPSPSALLGTDITLCLDMGSFRLWVARHLCNAKCGQLVVPSGRSAFQTNWV